MHESSRRRISLDQVRAANPGYQIERDSRRDPPRYSAVALDLGSPLRCLITDDIEELAAELATATDPRAS